MKRIVSAHLWHDHDQAQAQAAGNQEEPDVRQERGRLGVSCRDMLLMPQMEGAVLLAGSSGIRRRVSRVRMIEGSETCNAVEPGDLLLGSSLDWSSHTEDFVEQIARLHSKGAVGLALQAQGSLTAHPARVWELADRLGFPLIELPQTIFLSKLVREATERILTQETEDLARAQQRLQRLSPGLLRDDGIPGFLQALEDMLHNPLVLLDDQENVYVSPILASAGMGHADMWRERLESHREAQPATWHIKDQTIRAYVSPLPVQSARPGALALLEWAGDMGPVEKWILDHSSSLLGLEMVNTAVRRELSQKHRDRFLQDWLNGRMAEAGDLYEQAAACDCPLPGSSVCVVIIEWPEDQPDSVALQRAIRRMRMEVAPPRLYLTMAEGKLVAIVPAQSDECETEATLSQLMPLLQQMFATDSYVCCVGECVKEPLQLHSSYDSAKRVSRIRELSGYRAPYLDFRKLGVYRLLYLLPSGPELGDFCEPYIRPLLEYDRKHRISLLRTLRLYFAYNGNVKRTSEALDTHYNTIAYRIERAFELIGLHSGDGEDMLQLQLALKLHEMQPAMQDQVSRG